MKKLFALLCLLFATQAMAVEHITLSAGTPHTGWTWSVDHWVASSVQAQRVDFPDVTILAGHTYKYSVTIASRTAGSLQVMIGAPKVTPPAGTDLAPPATIADNFTTANGIFTSAPNALDSSADIEGAFRFRCGFATVRPDDPLVLPGSYGASHLHLFYGNTGINAYSTYKSLRLSGGTSCGDPRYPIYRSGIWTPSMLDGMGNILLPLYDDIYYKRVPAYATACQAAPDATHIGICASLPVGIRFVYGYDMKNMVTNAPNITFNCLGFDENPKAGFSTSGYATLKAVYDAGCRSPGMIYEDLDGPNCWDGTRADAADHRSNVSHNSGAMVNVVVNYLGSTQAPVPVAACPADHPYVIPRVELKLFYQADAAWDAGKWRLSSDEQMGTAVDAGTTAHMDYWAAWSPTVQATWESFCINGHRHCAAGELGDGTSFGNATTGANRNFSFGPLDPRFVVSLTKFGFSRLLQGNGTFTGEITPTAGGNIALYSPDGLSANVTAFSVTDVTKNTSFSPVTVHGTH